MTFCLYLWIGEHDDTFNSICAFQMDQSVDFELKRSNRCSNSGWPNPSMPSKWEWWLYNATNKNCNDWKWTSRCDEAYTKWHFQPFAGSDEQFREIISKFSKKNPPKLLNLNSKCNTNDEISMFRWKFVELLRIKLTWIRNPRTTNRQCHNWCSIFGLQLPIQTQLTSNSLFHCNCSRFPKCIGATISICCSMIVELARRWIPHSFFVLNEQYLCTVEFQWMTVYWHKAHNELHTVCKSYENSNSSK